MDKGSIFSTILAALLIVLVAVNILLALSNQSAQAEVAERQQAIAQVAPLENLHRQVVAVLANMAIRSNDEQIRSLLSSVGIDLGGGAKTAGPSPTPGAAPTPAPTK